MTCDVIKSRVFVFSLWHDNSGSSPGWYFSRMQVTDMQTKEKYFFINDCWLAVEEDDGMVSFFTSFLLLLIILFVIVMFTD